MISGRHWPGAAALYVSFEMRKRVIISAAAVLVLAMSGLGAAYPLVVSRGVDWAQQNGGPTGVYLIPAARERSGTGQSRKSCSPRSSFSELE